jgi:hypothetical protein
MTTSHPLIKTTRPGYANGSGLILEVLFDGMTEYRKLKSAEPYERNRPLSKEAQVKQLEECRDSWITNGGVKYARAKYRIGGYMYYPELGYVFEEEKLATNQVLA